MVLLQQQHGDHEIMITYFINNAPGIQANQDGIITIVLIWKSLTSGLFVCYCFIYLNSAVLLVVPEILNVVDLRPIIEKLHF